MVMLYAPLMILVIFTSSILGEDLYQALGIQKAANSKQIKAAYRKLSKRWHPDKNPGDKEANAKFQRINYAYENLSNPERRSVYDRYGEEGLKRFGQGGSGEGPGDPFDIFSQFFGGGGGRQRSGQQKGPTMVSEMEVDLEDVYIGRSIDFEINRQIICPTCKGSGARDPKDIKECSTCGGQGIRIVRHQLGPGIFQQMQMQCDACHGKGKMIAHSCSRCQGSQTIEQVNALTIDLDRGSPDGHEELFEGEGDESPDIDPGDVVLRIRIRKRHGGFSRIDENLYWRETLSLQEALLGFSRKVKHLDGHELTLSSKFVTQPGHVQTLEGEGMPRHQAMGHGNLFVEYSVVFPIEFSGLFRSRLEELFETHSRQSASHSNGEL